MITGSEVRELRRDLGWSAEDLATYWGVSRATVGVQLEGKKERPVTRQPLNDLLVSELRRTRGAPSKSTPKRTVTGDDLRAFRDEFGLATDELGNLLGFSVEPMREHIRTGPAPVTSGRRLALAMDELRHRFKLARGTPACFCECCKKNREQGKI